MLVLAGVAAAQPVDHLLVDEYVPLRLEFAPAIESIDEVFYWRRTSERYLVEVKITASTGILVGLDLILIPAGSVRVVDSLEAGAPAVEHEGLPIVELSPWKARIGAKEFGIDPSLRIVDEASRFDLEIGQDGVALSFNRGRTHTVVKTQGISFFFSESNELQKVVIRQLTRQQLATLRTAYG